jgi:CDP-paratose 2-epimerase
MRYQSLPWRLSDQRFFVADNGKAQRLLRWEPVITKEAGIEDMIQWEMLRED